MNLLDFFKEYLITRDSAPSKATVKNYLSDVRKFILWYEMTYHTRFTPENVTSSMIAKFREDKLARIRRGHTIIGGMSASSVERYTSSLRKFFSCLKDNGLIGTSPFDVLNEAKNITHEDKWHLKAFKNFLYTTNTSGLTIKNYIIDIRQFLSWAEEVTKTRGDSYVIDKTDILSKITPGLTEEYKYRLLHHLKLSPVSINRKLSSLRKYLTWASDQGLLASAPTIGGNIVEDKVSMTKGHEEYLNISPHTSQPEVFTDESDSKPREESYSRFPPLRLLQKLSVAGSALLDFGLTIPLAYLLEKVAYLKWAATGHKLFITSTSQLPNEATKAVSQALRIDPLGKIVAAAPNYKKSFYAPLSISTEAMPLHKKIVHTLRYSRPKWYKKYHSYTFVHYVHFALLIVFMTGIGMYVYKSYFTIPKEQSDVLAANVSPPRILSFQGRLTDSNDTPITAKTNLRFGIYNSQTASGSALLWQEVDSVTPDENGIFSVILGSGTQIPQSLFGQNAALYIGISVGSDAELVPRQQIATVAYATNAELLQGMPAITQPNAGTANVVLALDSSGNLTIGGTASPTFQATGGTFTLSGNTLNLTTSGNGNVLIAPGGTGMISMQSPITNLGNNNTMPGISGAVQFNDNIGVYNTGVQSAISIYQTSSGNVITASQSGNTVFSVNNSGQGYFAQALGVGQQNPSSMLYVTSGGDSTTATFNSSATTNTIFSFLNNGNQFASLNRNSNGDTQLNTNNANNIILMPGGNIGLGTTSPTSFDVQSAGNVGPDADNTYTLGSSGMRWSNIYGVNTTTQNLTIPGLTNAGGVLYTNASGTVAQTSTGTTGDCLISQGTSTPSWSPCAAASGSVWTVGNGAIMPLYENADLLLGGNSTASAKFAVLNMASGTPTAYINGNIGVGTTSPTANVDIVGTLQASGSITANGGMTLGLGQTLAIGGDTISDFVGSGLQMNGTTLETTLGTTIDLTSEVTGVLPIANGGTNSTATPTAGGIAYGTGSAYAFSSAGSAGQVLVSNGSGAPTWADASSVGNYWQLNSGALSPTNSTNDLLLGSNATSSALIRLAGTSGGNSYFNTGGNVGIGTTNPTQLLTVQKDQDAFTYIAASNQNSVGTAAAASLQAVSDVTSTRLTSYGTGAGASGQLLSNASSFFIDSQNAAGRLIFRIGATPTELMRIESSGNVGVGNTSPTAKLSVGSNDLAGTAASTTFKTQAGNLGNTAGNELALASIGFTSGNQSSLGIRAIRTANGSSWTTTAIGLGMDVDNTVRSGANLWLNASGNIGIGETAPVTKLQVNGVITTTQGLDFNNGSKIWEWNLFGNDLNLSEVGVLNGRLYVQAGGNVGIGTTSPTANLHIAPPSGNATVKAQVANASTNNPEFSLQDSTGAGWSMFSDSAGSDTFNIAKMASGSWSANYLSIKYADGNVGIGTTSPTATLDVAGTTRFEGDIAQTGGINALGDQGSMVPNASFEINNDGTTTVADGWTTETSGTASFSINSSTPANGSYAQNISANSGANYGNIKSICFPITGGRSYYLMARVKSNVATSQGLYLRLLTYTTKDTCESNTSATSYDSLSNASVATNYQDRGTTTFGDGSTITPATTQLWGRVQIWNFQPNVTATFSVDGAKLIPTQLNSGFDLAETYPIKTGDNIEPGDVVKIGESAAKGNLYVEKTTKAYDDHEFGIVSTNPGIVLDDGEEYAKVQVALAGRVPVKVSTENGPIKSGDRLTSSSVPGVAMKATQAGQVLGKALENFDEEGVGKVLLFVNTSWYDPDVHITDSGILNIDKTATGEFVAKKDGEIVDRLAIFSEAIIAKLQAGALQATQITAESITIAGMSLRDYILSVVEATNSTHTVVSPIDGKLAVNVISPLADDSDIELGFKKDNIVVTDKNGKIAASIDNKGNATLSGTLQTNEASVAGTLTAGKVQTDELDLSEEGIAKLKDKLGTNSATIVNNITNVYQQATPSATPTISLTATPIQSEPTPNSSNSGTTTPPTLTAQTDYADISSMSGILAYVPSLSADFATFTKGLMSFGPSSLSDTSVTGNLTVNGNMILAENSINVLGADLQIQPLRQGNVSFMSGLVKIDIDGNMSVEGNATFGNKVAIRGFLETNFISPIPGENLVINLPTVAGTDRASSFVISDASGSAKFRVNNLGDVIASGSGQFKNLTTDAFKIIRGAQADTSLTETVATASAGTATIGKNQTERTVYSPFVKEDSLIYITPNSNTEGLTPYIARQTAESKDENTKGSFTIQLPDLAPSDIRVNWWIVN